MTVESLALVAVIGAGGTISSLATDERDYINYPETGRKLTIDEVIERVPQLAQFARLKSLPFRSVGSSAIGPEDWLRLHRTITDAIAEQPEVTGVVVLHGTATLEETAYFLHLTLPAERPVVVVGAQRPLNTLSTDATANTINAVRVAADPQAHGRGVMVVLNDEIHSAREVTKGSTYRLHAFHSGAFGPLGVADPDRIVFSFDTRRPAGSGPAFDLSGITTLPRVDITYAYAGSDGTAVKALQAAGAQGLVSAGFAPGMPAPLEREALVQAAKAGIVVVQASRVGQGRVARRDWLIEQNWVGSGDLNPQKARILLSLALLRTKDPTEIQKLFDTY
jgi:L-asparaginase